MTATTCSVWRSFIEAEETQMRASRTVAMMRAMNTGSPWNGCDWRCDAGLSGGGWGWRPGRSAAFLADLWGHFGAEQFDGLEVGGVRHAADVHLQDLAVMDEQFVQGEDAVGDLVGPSGEHHPAGLHVGGTVGRRLPGAPDLGGAGGEHAQLVL